MSDNVNEDGKEPDEIVKARTFARIEKSGGKLAYFTACKMVLAEDPELAEKYRSQPGVKGGKAA